MILLSKEELLERLRLLDRDASLVFPGKDKFSVIIVGSGALLLMGYTTRHTHDIDVLQGTLKELSGLFVKYDINCNVAAYENSFPYNYEDRCKLLLSGQRVEFFTASLEDIVIAKLCASRPQDKQDLEEVVPYVNWDVLENLATNENELKSSIMNNDRYSEFRYFYEDYVRRYKP